MLLIYAKLKNDIRHVVTYKDYFTDFYSKLTADAQKKTDWTIMLVRELDAVPQKYFKHLSGTNGLWEIRVAVSNGIFRIFCFFDKGNMVILLGGFQKKSQKTPRNEILKAERLKKEYFENKERL